jgi:N-acetylmuramoyl-L-alanine amidase CwlA
VPHYRWSGKECPVLLLNGGKPGAKWQAFVNQVQEQLDSIE